MKKRKWHYCYLLSNGRQRYVGRTMNLKARLQQHWINQTIDRYGWHVRIWKTRCPHNLERYLLISSYGGTLVNVRMAGVIPDWYTRSV